MARQRAHILILAVVLTLGLYGGLPLSPSVGAANVPVKAPSAPTSLAVIPVNTALVVSWMAPTWTGGAPISSYVVNVVPGHESCTTVSLGCTVTGLSNGTQYAVRVQAVNSVHAGGVARAKAIPSTTPNCSYVGVWANLQGCDLTAANLKLTDLSNANLSEANLTGADLLGANLTGATLSGADLTNANLEFADLDAVALVGVIWSNTICPDAIPSDLVGDTCANDVSDEIAQAHLTAVLSAANASWASNGTFTGVSSGQPATGVTPACPLRQGPQPSPHPSQSPYRRMATESFWQRSR